MIETGRRPVRSCPRCGIRREVNPARLQTVCRDCRSVLKPAELKVWAA